MHKNPYENVDDAIERLAERAKHNGEKPKEDKVRLNLMINKSTYEAIVQEVSNIQKKQGKPYAISSYVRDIIENYVNHKNIKN